MSDFIDALINKITPDEMIAPPLLPIDTIVESEMQLAEQVGRKLAEAADGAVLAADSDRFADSTNSPFSAADIGRYINILSGANAGLFRIVAFVDASNVDCVAVDGTDPSFVDQSGISYAIHDEPSLEEFMNYMLTQTREIIDPANDWFDAMPKAFDPSNTDGSDTANEKMNLKVLADNWYGSKTKIIDILTGSIAVSSSDIGALHLTSLSYADPSDRRGLVIQSSVANAGSYQDEVALSGITLGKHKVMLIDVATDAEFMDASGNLIYGVLQDGADHSGSGEGTDVFIKFVYDNAGVPTAYTWGADDPANIIAYIPQRKRRSELSEFDDRRAFVSSVVGDAEQAEDIEEIRDALGIADGEGAGDWDLTNTGNFFPFSELGVDPTMEDIVNKLNEEIGSRDYTDENIVTDGQTITESIDALDKFVGQGGYKTKIIERVTSLISKNSAHTIPFASGSDALITSYKQDTAHFGRYMEIRVAGVKLVPDSSAIAVDGQYEETSSTTFTPRFNIRPGQIIEYIVIDDA
jgi:hypothetical protein